MNNDIIDVYTVDDLCEEMFFINGIDKLYTDQPETNKYAYNTFIDNNGIVKTAVNIVYPTNCYKPALLLLRAKKLRYPEGIYIFYCYIENELKYTFFFKHDIFNTRRIINGLRSIGVKFYINRDDIYSCVSKMINHLLKYDKLSWLKEDIGYYEDIYDELKYCNGINLWNELIERCKYNEVRV